MLYLRGESGHDCTSDLSHQPWRGTIQRELLHCVLLHPRGAPGRAAQTHRPRSLLREQAGVHRVRQVFTLKQTFLSVRL